MADVWVRLKGDDSDLKKKLDSSEKQVNRSASSMLGAMKGLVATAATGAVAMFFKSAVQASVDFETSQRKLEATSKLTGIALDDLQNTAKTGTDQFKLSAPLANDFSVELGKLAAKAGDVSKATPGMAAFLDLGAARGLSASETLKAVQQSILGIDEGTDKLFGKNPSVLYKEYADQIGTTAGKLTDQQKAQALLTAALGDGLKVQGEYGAYLGTFGGALSSINIGWEKFKVAVGGAILAGGDAQNMATGIADILASLAGWIERNEDGFIIFKDAIFAVGRALFDVGKAIYEVVEPALGPVLKGLFVALLTSLHTASLGVSFLAAGFKGLAGDTLQALGTMVEKGGSLLKVFGVDVVAEAGASIKQFGETLTASARASLTQATQTYSTNMANLFRGRRQQNAEAEKEERRSQGVITQTHGTSAGERIAIAEREAKERMALIERVNKKLEDAAKGITLAATETKDTWGEIDREATKAAETIELGAEAQRRLSDFSASTEKHQREIAAQAAAARDQFADQVDSARAMGGAFIDAGQAMGVIDDEAASAMNSVLNMAASIAKFGIGSPEGIISIIGGLANLITGWGDSAAEAERKTAIASNTRALNVLSQTFADYTIGIPGEQFDRVTQGLEHWMSLQDDPETPRFISPSEMAQYGRQFGFTIEQAREIAEHYGIDVDKDPFGWWKLLQILKTRKYGSPEGNFAQELDQMNESFDILGIEDEDDQVKLFRDFLRTRVPILADALEGDLSTESGRQAAIDKLRELYTRSVKADLQPADYGKSTPAQFRQIIASLLDILGSADGVPSVAGVPNDQTIPETGTGGDVFGQIASGAVGTGAGMRFSPSIGAAGSSSVEFPSLGGVGEGGTYIEGGVHITVVQREDEDGEALAARITDLVLRRAGDKYALQRSSLGLHS